MVNYIVYKMGEERIVFNIDSVNYTYDRYCPNNYELVCDHATSHNLIRIAIDVNCIIDDVEVYNTKYRTDWLSLMKTSYDADISYTSVNKIIVFLREGDYIYNYKYDVSPNEKVFNIRIKNGVNNTCITVNGKAAKSRLRTYEKCPCILF
jgi:hypothetical protein